MAVAPDAVPPPSALGAYSQDIAAAVAEGRCILFLGAGAHYPPPADSTYSYPEAQRPPLGDGLARTLAEACGFVEAFPRDSPTNLQRVSLCYEQRFSRRRLVETVEHAVHDGKEPSPVIRGLAQLPFPIIVTTNYDNLCERALSAAGKQPRVSVYDPADHAIADDDLTDPTAERPLVFKIHGDVAKPESIVITDEDYIQFVLRMNEEEKFRPIPETVLYRFRRWMTLFVGYSLMDYNLRLLLKTLRWRLDSANLPDAYSVDLRPDPLIKAVYEEQRRYVRFIVLDQWSFVPDLYQRVLGAEMPT